MDNYSIKSKNKSIIAHSTYIKRCLELAVKGLGTTYPNPLVGSVIVHNNTIIGEGWHKKAGAPHAEVLAINSVSDRSLLKEATIYVSLEPCSHFGKTPPCANLIIATGIKKVVIGCTDPNPKVAGQGIAKLKEAGCQVTVGVLEQECIALNARFFNAHLKNRPYIILKWAQSADKFIAPIHKNKQAPVWLSSPASRQLVHKWRTQEQAILIGTTTAQADNPSLTARDWDGPSPLRVVIDIKNKLDKNLNVFNQDAKTLIVTREIPEKTNKSLSYFKVSALENLENELLAHLALQHIQSIIIEGGRYTLERFIKANLWDEARIFNAPIKLEQGIAAPTFNFKPTHTIASDSDKLRVYFNPTTS